MICYIFQIITTKDFFPYYEMKNTKKLLSIYNSRFTCSKYMANIKHESSL